jgi:redox-sensitive bicupin YhaK (pirin superfamily)
MHILSKSTLTLGGFAGLLEHRIVTDTRLFGQHKSPESSEGLGNFVYLADAQFNPHGETGMHSHMEIDVISVMIDGQVSHAGSLENGQGLEKGDVQVQRAGGDGFSHNEINPNSQKNRMIQLWAIPEEKGQPAGYKYYSPKAQGVTRIYGGNKQQSDTFDSSTIIDIVKLEIGENIQLANDSLVYVTDGNAEFVEENDRQTVQDGDLIRSINSEVRATASLSLIVVHQ